MLVSPNTKLVQKLEENNSFLAEKSHQFSKICSAFKIFSCYETRKTKGIMVPYIPPVKLRG